MTEETEGRIEQATRELSSADTSRLPAEYAELSEEFHRECRPAGRDRARLRELAARLAEIERAAMVMRPTARRFASHWTILPAAKPEQES